MASSLARLTAAVEVLARGDAPEPVDARWLGQALAAYLADDLDLGDALGLPWGWRRDLRHAQRDGLIQALAATFPGSPNARAVATAGVLRRYGATGWPHERRLVEAPPHASAERRLLFGIYRLDGDPPTGIRRLTEIITSDLCSSRDLITASRPVDSADTEAAGACV